MNRNVPLIAMLTLLAALPGFAGDKKKHANRAMIERMEAVPCGAKQKGLTGLGSFWASVGVTHVNSDEKVCPEYLLRTDELDYRIRPSDMKHAVVLPVGHEVVFKIEKNRMLLRTPEGDKKMRPYEVVSMQPATSNQSSHVN